MSHDNQNGEEISDEADELGDLEEEEMDDDEDDDFESDESNNNDK